MISKILILAAPPDVLRFGKTCKRFQQLTAQDTFWKQVHQSHWPEATPQIVEERWKKFEELGKNRYYSSMTLSFSRDQTWRAEALRQWIFDRDNEHANSIDLDKLGGVASSTISTLLEKNFGVKEDTLFYTSHSTHADFYFGSPSAASPDFVRKVADKYKLIPADFDFRAFVKSLPEIDADVCFLFFFSSSFLLI